jgi:hypothetical protein
MSASPMHANRAGNKVVSAPARRDLVRYLIDKELSE